MRVLIALGGNALLGRGEPAEAGAQEADVSTAAEALASVAAEHELVISHGDGPQVGVELALRNALPDRDLVTVPIGIVVDAGDSKLERGSRPLTPQAVIELFSLRTLIDAGVLVICAGGGGIPVALDDEGTMHGVEAVVDKDLTASLLARRLDVDLLVMLTDVDVVHLNWGTDGERGLGKVTPAELREHGLASGSMRAKVEAACRFAEATGRRAAIGELTKAVEIVRGASGTQISAPSA